jgi:hypothetical protein
VCQKWVEQLADKIMAFYNSLIATVLFLVILLVICGLYNNRKRKKLKEDDTVIVIEKPKILFMNVSVNWLDVGLRLLPSDQLDVNRTLLDSIVDNARGTIGVTVSSRLNFVAVAGKTETSNGRIPFDPITVMLVYILPSDNYDLGKIVMQLNSMLNFTLTDLRENFTQEMYGTILADWQRQHDLRLDKR